MTALGRIGSGQQRALTRGETARAGSCNARRQPRAAHVARCAITRLVDQQGHEGGAHLIRAIMILEHGRLEFPPDSQDAQPLQARPLRRMARMVRTPWHR